MKSILKSSFQLLGTSSFSILAVTIIALLLRFYNLSSVPLSLNWDETSNLYNAYSILKTGKDEYSNFLPPYNRSFNDYKPPLYMYLDTITINIFGYNNLAARVPSALLGALSIPLVYFLAQLLLNNKKISILSAFFIATSPWHIHLSRAGFEANVGLFFTILSFVLLIKALNFDQKPGLVNKLSILFSGLIFGISFYTYHSVRIFAPILFVATVYIYRKKISAFPKKFTISFLAAAIIIILPVLIFSTKKAVLLRIESTSQETFSKSIENSNQILSSENNNLFIRSLYSPQIIYAKNLLSNYFAHYDPNFLFISGDNNYRHHVEGMGNLYLFQLPLILAAFLYLLKRRTEGGVFLLFWLFLSPISAAPTNEVPHAIRSFSMVIPLQILSAIPLATVTFKKNYIKNIFIIIASVTFLIVNSIYLHNYFVHYPKDHADSWQYGYDIAAKKTESLKYAYDKVFIDESVEEGYIFWLVANKYDPSLYQRQGRENFDKYYFSGKPQNKREALVSIANKFPENYIVIDTIYYPNGVEALKIGHPK